MSDVTKTVGDLPVTRDDASAPDNPVLGLVVGGRFKIEQPLAEGGMGSVYLGLQENLRRQVAIKRVSNPDVSDAERFRREAEALATVSHPAIVEVYDYVDQPDDGVSYLIMAYVDGENLADYVEYQPDGVIHPVEVLELMVPVASALVELHAHKILHRDIKPANLVRYERADKRASVKLVDFGIARRAQDPGLTADGLIVGTPPYLSPEVILGKAHSGASDVYAYGATLFELLTGDAPHGKEDLHHILRRATQEDVTLPEEHARTPLGTLLLRMLTREDEDRPSMQDVLDEMEQILITLLSKKGDPKAALRTTAARAGGPGLHGSVPPTGAPAGDQATVVINPRHGSVPWILAGLGGLLSISLLIVLLVGGTDHRKPKGSAPTARSGAVSKADAGAVSKADASAVSKADASAASTRSDAGRSGAGEHRRPPARRRTDESVAKTNVKLALAATKLLAGCTDTNKAINLYLKASRLRWRDEHRAWCKAAYYALVRCEHTPPSRRMRSAFRLAQLHSKDGECDEVEATWQLWIKLGGRARNARLRKPTCQRK